MIYDFYIFAICFYHGLQTQWFCIPIYIFACVNLPQSNIKYSITSCVSHPFQHGPYWCKVYRDLQTLRSGSVLPRKPLLCFMGCQMESEFAGSTITINRGHQVTKAPFVDISVQEFQEFAKLQTCYIHQITFIFGRCQCSLAAVTPAKYKSNVGKQCSNDSETRENNKLRKLVQ